MTLMGVTDHHMEQKHQEHTAEKKATKAPQNGSKNGSSTDTSHSMLVKEDKDRAMVQTPYGSGLVIRTRKDPKTFAIVSRDIELTDWKTATPKKGPPRPAMLYSSAKFPSVAPKVGSEVTCLFGRGRVIELRDNHQVVVQLSSWRLAGRSRITCFVNIDAVQVVQPKLVYEMTTFERVEHAQSLKEEARQIFAKKEYERALSKYALAVDAVRYVQHQKDSTNEVRADLLVVMITSCNNAATCAARDGDGKWDLVTKYARNALVLIEALEERQSASKTTRVFDILTREGFDAVKIFGEWKGKSLLFLAKAQAQKQNNTEALEACKKAQEAIASYLEKDPNNKVLLQHEKDIKRLRATCKQRKQLELKKEKQRAQAMFGSPSKEVSPEKGPINGDKTTTSPTAATIPTAKTAVQPNGTINGKKVFMEYSESSEKKNAMDDSSKKKNVTFEDGGTPRDAYDNPKTAAPDDDVDEEELAWYEEHQELLVLVGILTVGIAATQMMLGRRNRS